MSFYSEFKWRGLINNVTNEEKVKLFDKEKSSAYIGFDPSFDSLHLGNYNMLLVLRRLKQAGHNVYAILGGATGLIGDPSGKKVERVMLDEKKVSNNLKAIEEQIKKYSGALVFNNIDIYKDMSVFNFLRNVGKLINVNYLLEKDIIKSRLETGISYAEFSYSLIQGYDFAWLYNNKGVTMQIGGSDQWGNITTGIEMIRKLKGDDNKACGLTITLLTKADGTKFGKSENGAIYLNPKYTSPFTMYQFLFNQPDSEVESLLKFLTMYSKEEIDDIVKQHKAEPFKRLAQRKLAEAIIKDIHGEKDYEKSLFISESFYSGNVDKLSNTELHNALTSIPSISVKGNKYNIIDLLVECKVTPSKSIARQLITSNSVKVNNKQITSFDEIISKTDAIDGKFSYIKKGKKDYFLINWV